MMKKWIARLFGQRKSQHHGDFSSLKSVLLKPIGDAIGDAVVHIAHLQQLKKAFPQVKIGVLVSGRNRAIFEFAQIADELIENKSFNYVKQRKKWQLYLDFLPVHNTRSLILDFILKPEIVINFGKLAKKYYNENTVKNADYCTEIPFGVHFKDFLNYSVLGCYLTKPVYYSLPKTLKKADYFPPNKINVLINPQGSNRFLPPNELEGILAKILPVHRAKMALRITNVAGCERYQPLVTASDLDMQFAPKLGLLDYFSLIEQADLVISVDSGAVHIACAYEKPLLAFYANYPLAFERWKPPVKPSIPSCVLVGKTAENNALTEGFDLQQAADWLNTFLNTRTTK